ncbi:MAG: hypothetical protein GY846_03770 [Deltaproteobacteria bacterium]|nr:hypothetical protein [Deltaproteobacteria bacterium]
MSSGSKINIDVDLGRKGIEKTEIYVYMDGRLIETHFDKSYDDIRLVAEDLKGRYKDAEVEVTCEGEDLFGRIHKWPLEI